MFLFLACVPALFFLTYDFKKIVSWSINLKNLKNRPALGEKELRMNIRPPAARVAQAFDEDKYMDKKSEAPESGTRGGLLGEAITSGEAEMSIDGKLWVRLGRIHPIPSGGHFRTAQGRFTFIFFGDMVHLALAEHSMITIAGTPGDYAVQLGRGKLNFLVPVKTNLRIKTADLMVEIKHDKDALKKLTSSPAGGGTKGTVYYDGNKTHVMTYAGSIIIKTLSGKNIMELTEGNSVSISSAGDSKLEGYGLLAAAGGAQSAPPSPHKIR